MVDFMGINMLEVTAENIKRLEPKIRELNDVKRYNLPDMACRLDISVGTLRNYVAILKIELNNYAPCRRNNMKRWMNIIPHMIANGKNYEEIAKRLKTSTGSISRWVCNNGLSKKDIQ